MASLLAIWALNAAAASAAAAAAATSEANAATSATLAEDWASKTDGIVDSTDYSSKAWSIGGTGVTNNDGAAKEWATKAEDSTVDGTLFSALHYAAKASDSATTAANEATTATNAVKDIINYDFSNSTTMADPGAGNIRLNNASFSSVTAIAIDDQTAQTGNPDIAGWIATWDDSTSPVKGTLKITKENSPTDFAIYNVTALTDNTGWSQLTVTHVDSNGSFTDADSLFIEFYRTGDAGTTFTSSDITGQTEAVIGADDYLVYSDTGDSGNLKKDTVQGVLETVTSLTSVTAAATDELLINDASDSGAAKKVTAQSIADLAGGGAWELLATATASASATVNFTGFMNSTYDYYVLQFDSFNPSTDSVALYLRLGNGGTYESSGYAYSAAAYRSTGSFSQAAAANQIEIYSNTELGNDSDEGVSGVVSIFNPSSATFATTTFSNIVGQDTNTVPVGQTTSGGKRSASAHTDVQLFFSSGTIDTGEARLYGVKKS